MSKNIDIYNIDINIIELLSNIYDDEINRQYLYNYNKNFTLIMDKTKDFYSAPIAPTKDNFDYLQILKSCKSFYDKN